MINIYKLITNSSSSLNEISGVVKSGTFIPISSGATAGAYFNGFGYLLPQNGNDGNNGTVTWPSLNPMPPGASVTVTSSTGNTYIFQNLNFITELEFDNQNQINFQSQPPVIAITSITSNPNPLLSGQIATITVNGSVLNNTILPYTVTGTGFLSSFSKSGTLTFNNNTSTFSLNIPQATQSGLSGTITVNVNNGVLTQTFNVTDTYSPPCVCQSYVAPVCSCDCNYSCTCNCNYETSTRGPSCTVVGNDCILYRLAFLGSNGTWYVLTSSTNNQHSANYGTISWGLLPYTQTNDIVTITVPSGVSITKICDIESVSGQSTTNNVFELDIIIPGVGSYVYKGSGVLSPISIVPQSGSFQIYVLGWINYCSGNTCTTDWFYFTPTPDWTDSPLLPGTVVKAQHITELQNQINLEYKRRSKPTYSFPSLGSIVKYSDVYQLYNAISQISTSLQWHENFATPLTGQVIKAVNIEDLRDNINYLQTQCICNCNYCTCNCNYACTCNCNYACTCNCNYACTCNCNYACTCNCNYACTCNCNYACTCNCNNACSCQSNVTPSCSCQSNVTPSCSCQSNVTPSCSCQSYVTPTAHYSCPSGYTLQGTQCTTTFEGTFYAAFVYTCPNGSGGTYTTTVFAPNGTRPSGVCGSYQPTNIAVDLTQSYYVCPPGTTQGMNYCTETIPATVTYY